MISIKDKSGQIFLYYMIGKAIAAAVVISLIFLAFQMYLTFLPQQRAILLKLPEVPGSDRGCIYNNVVDVVESTIEGILFTADELISLSCFDSKNYTIEIYNSVNPVDERDIDNLFSSIEPDYNISENPVYLLSDSRFFYKQESILVFLSFAGFSTSEALEVVSDSINERNSYDLTYTFELLDRIPEESSILDSSIYQRQVYVSNELTTVLKGWYVGTTRLASQQAFIFLRKPRDIETRCYHYNNESTPYGDLFLCYANDSCGPKYLVLSDDSIAYAQDANDMDFTCSSVEDAFTTDILRNVR